MRRFLIRRLFASFISLIGATAIVFLLSRAAGDPILLYAKPAGYGMSPERIENLHKKLGLDKPIPVQYLVWLGQVVKGDLGKTLQSEQPVRKVIWEKMGATAQLALAGWMFALLVGVPIGIISAVKRGSIWDYLGRGFALGGQAIPSFWIGIVAILIFSVQLGWLPSGFKGDGFSPKHFIMPAFTIGIGSAAVYVRLLRASMLEALDSEYIKLARAKGVSNTFIIWKHAFKNALLPVLTVSALLMAGLLNGAVVAEVIFAWPGVGRIALVEAVHNNDFPLLLGAVLIFAVIYLVFNLLADVLYGVIDPRIRYD